MPPQIKSNIGVAVGVLSFLFTALGAAYDIGYRNSSASFDKEKVDLIDKNDSLKFSTERLKSIIRSDSVNNENWMLQHTTGIYMNSLPNDLQTLLVVNLCSGRCDAGKASNCWLKETRAMIGDSISVQIYFHNSGEIKLYNVSVELSQTKQDDDKTIIFKSKILVNDTVVNVGSVSVFVTKPSTALYSPNSIRLYPNQNLLPTYIPDDEIIDDKKIKIGDLPPSWFDQGVVVLDFKIVKLS